MKLVKEIVIVGGCAVSLIAGLATVAGGIARAIKNRKPAAV